MQHCSTTGDAPTMLPHGGRLRAAAARYGIPPDHWLDLSTGINPHGWPVGEIPAVHWRCLPQDDDELPAAAGAYYGTGHVLPVAGSQAAIQCLPQLRPPARTVILHPGYAEHAAAWRRAGHAVTLVAAEDLDRHLRTPLEVAVLIHPNNPTGVRFPVDQLLDWHERLAARGGWLVVDEAFMDPTPEYSLCRYASRPGLIVLRSVGKFFGLAGARVGFVCAAPALLERLHAALGPWPVNAPARWVTTAALRDDTWQTTMRRHLCKAGQRLYHLLTRHDLPPEGGCALFQWARTPRATELYEALAQQGILTRLFRDPPSLRFGLPGEEAGWQRLDRALARCTRLR